MHNLLKRGIGVLLIAICSPIMVHAEEFVCPVGGEVFSMQLPRGATPVGQNYDFKPYGAGVIAPRPLPVCPGNGFIVFHEEFSDEELARLTQFVESNEFQNARDEQSLYYRLAKLLEVQGQPILRVAFTYLQASWEVDQQPDKYRDYATLANTAFKTYLVNGDPNSPDFLTSHLLVTELHRRLGEFDEAKATLDSIKRHKEAEKPYASQLIIRLYQLIAAKDAEPAHLP